MLRRKDSSGKESVLGGEIFDKVVREGLLGKVTVGKDPEEVRKLAAWIWGGALHAERAAIAKAPRWALAWGVQRTTEMSLAGSGARWCRAL